MSKSPADLPHPHFDEKTVTNHRVAAAVIIAIFVFILSMWLELTFNAG